MAAKTQHPHAEILRAIADGEFIQVNKLHHGDSDWWIDISPEDYFSKYSSYSISNFRIKPAKVYPVTSYTGEELHDIYIFEDGPPETAPNAFTRLANLVIKRHVDEQETASEG